MSTARTTNQTVMSTQLSLFGNERTIQQGAISFLAEAIAHDQAKGFKITRKHPLYKVFKESKEVIAAGDEERARRILAFLLDNSECGVRLGHERNPDVDALYRRGCEVLGREPLENKVPEVPQ